MNRDSIVIVNYEFPPVGGGAGRASYQLARRLVERDEFEYHLIFGTDPHHPGWPQIRKAHQYPITMHRKSVHETGGLGMAQFLLKAIPILRSITRNRPVRIIHYIFSVPTGLLAFVQPRSIPYLVSLHGGDVPGFVEGEHTLSHILLKPLNKWIIRGASELVAVSRSLADAVERDLGATTCRVIHNGIDPGPTPIQRSPNNQFRICCVARLTPWKRIDLLINSLRHFPDATLNIVGTGCAEGALRSLTDRLGLSAQVTFSGYVPDNKVRDHLDKADIFALPSVGDSFGIVFLEAMAAGLPVIGARACGVPEVVQDGVNGILVPPNNCDALIKAIRFLKENPQCRRELGNASRRIVRSDFAWNRITDRYLDCYHDILESREDTFRTIGPNLSLRI